MKHLNTYTPAIGIFFLALLVRIVYNVTAARGYIPIFDAGLYNNIAGNLIREHCYCYRPPHPTVFRPPLWPFLIATIYLFVGEHSAYVRLFCCLLGSGTCVLVYLFAKELFGKRISLITGVIAAMYTGLFIWDGWLYTESLYTFCLTAFIYSLYRFQRNISSRSWLVMSGIFLGLAALTRPNGSFLFDLLCLWAALVTFAKVIPWTVTIRSVFIIGLITLTMNAPWLYRNFTVTDSLMPASAMGQTLAGSYNDSVLRPDPLLHGMWNLPKSVPNADFMNYTKANEDRDIQQAFSWIRTHKQLLPTLFGLHALNMWKPYNYSYGLPFEEFPNRFSSKIIQEMIPIMSIPIFLLAALGLVVTWKRWKKHLLMSYLVIAMTIAQNIAFYGSPRFRAPIEPLLVLLVGGALCWLQRTILHSKLLRFHL